MTMRVRLLFALAVFSPILFPLVACQPGGAPGSPQTQSGNYRGSINGAEATAHVTFEPLPEHTLMAGEIRRNEYYYTFTADLVGASGYGDLLDHKDNSTIRIKIDVTADGFQLTSNPLGPGAPSTYTFVRE